MAERYIKNRFLDLKNGYTKAFLDAINDEYFNKAMLLPIEERRGVMGFIDMPPDKRRQAMEFINNLLSQTQPSTPDEPEVAP